MWLVCEGTGKVAGSLELLVTTTDLSEKYWVILWLKWEITLSVDQCQVMRRGQKRLLSETMPIAKHRNMPGQWLVPDYMLLLRKRALGLFWVVFCIHLVGASLKKKKKVRNCYTKGVEDKRLGLNMPHYKTPSWLLCDIFGRCSKI